MQIGEIIIKNDVIGVITAIDGDKVIVHNRKNKEFTFDVNTCTSIINPHALAKLTYDRLVKDVSK